MDCIWTGLVKELICDKQFECENCELDKVFRKLCSKKNETNYQQINCELDLIEKYFKLVQSETFDESIIYLKSQLVLKNIFGNVYYLGINPVLLQLLDDYDIIHQSETNEIRKGQKILTLEGKWGKKDFISPADFTIIEKINFSRFRLHKWYAIIMMNEIDNDELQLSKEDWDYKKMQTLILLKDCSLHEPQIGQRMLDGGTKVRFFHQYFGGKKYQELLNRIFE